MSESATNDDEGALLAEAALGKPRDSALLVSLVVAKDKP
jgi:hypothetical protein